MQAKELWRAEVTPRMQKYPERSPLALPKLLKKQRHELSD